MSKRDIILLPKLARILATAGENIKLARLRRKYTTDQVAQRANISRTTVWMIETGTPGVSVGAYLQVLFVLGLEEDMGRLAGNDPLGRKLQDAELITAARAPRSKRKPQSDGKTE
ncbi:MAG: helix-turn-helix transcriptional regulator [Bacteroidetes bacterium]|nr:helix-turn-helix transcriptional regulator [Bacteroidota bacterium]